MSVLTNNTTLAIELENYGQHSLVTIVSLSIVYGLLSLMAFLGNSIVIWIICKYLHLISLGSIVDGDAYLLQREIVIIVVLLVYILTYLRRLVFFNTTIKEMSRSNLINVLH